MSAVPKDFDHTKLSGSDKEYLKEIQFSKDIAQSPVEKPRRCTDMVCCIIFSVAVGAMFFFSILGYINGEPWKLVAPIDGNNNICGYSEGYEEYSHLYIDDITEAIAPSNIMGIFSYGVCVKECPKEKTDPIECKTTSTV